VALSSRQSWRNSEAFSPVRDSPELGDALAHWRRRRTPLARMAAISRRRCDGVMSAGSSSMQGIAGSLRMCPQRTFAWRPARCLAGFGNVLSCVYLPGRSSKCRPWVWRAVWEPAVSALRKDSNPEAMKLQIRFSQPLCPAEDDNLHDRNYAKKSTNDPECPWGVGAGHSAHIDAKETG
jgi:hypothetical protein